MKLPAEMAPRADCSDVAAGFIKLRPNLAICERFGAGADRGIDLTMPLA
jgi:hypothetical protein